MKANFFLAIIATSALLTACGGSHEKVHAVDKIEEAQKQALEKAPKAEEIKFADHGQPTLGGVGGAAENKQQPTPAQEAAADKANATAEILTAAHHGEAAQETTKEPAATEATASADKAATDNAAATDSTKTAEAPATEQPAEPAKEAAKTN